MTTKQDSSKDLDRSLVDRAVAGDRAALDGVVAAIKDDVYNLAMRMLGGGPDAEDATQEILIQIITHLAQWRGDASFRTWTWRIAARHMMKVRRSQEESVATFEVIEELIHMGEANPALPSLTEAELQRLETELRIACTQGMLTSVDRDQRLSFILSEVFELDSNQAAAVLDVDAATHRKRLQRARERLGDWMSRHCGIVNPLNACRCRRQIPVAIEVGAVDPHNLVYVAQPERAHPRRKAPPLDPAEQINVAAFTLCCHPDYAAPEALIAKIRALIDAGTFELMS